MIALWAGLGTAAAGSLSGVVVDETGAAVPDATVTALDPRLAWSEATSDAQGRFHFTDLPPNPYRIQVIAAQDDDLVPRYAPSEIALCDGGTFDVGTSGDTDAGAVVLPTGARIIGRLVDAAGDAVVGAQLASESDLESAPRIAQTDAFGDFELRGVVTHLGPIRVVVDADDLPSQYLGTTLLADEALMIDVRANTTTDAGTHELLSGITASGTVFGPDGQPVTEGSVSAYTPSQLRTVDVAPDGTWEVRGLPPGDVLAWAEVDALANTYWPDADRPDQRLPAPNEGQVVTGMDITLPAEASLVGRLVGGEDWTGTSVLLYNSDRTVGFADVPDADGSFAVTGLHGGAYTVFVNAEAAGLVSDFVRDPDGTEMHLELPDADVLDLGDLEMPSAATLEGTVNAARDGAPVFGATVYAQAGTGADIELGIVQRDGTFTIGGLPAGPWTLSASYATVCPDDPGFVAMVHPGDPNSAFAVPVDLDVDDLYTWDVDLPPDDDHDGMDDSWERRHELDPARDDGGEDPDDDGFTNLEEYLLGTDPMDGNNGCGCTSSAGGSNAVWLTVWGLLYRARRAPRGDRAPDPRAPAPPTPGRSTPTR